MHDIFLFGFGVVCGFGLACVFGYALAGLAADGRLRNGGR